MMFKYLPVFFLLLLPTVFVVAEEDIAKLQQMATQGDAIAQYDLASLYETGQGVEQDFNKALGLLKQSADQGYAPAQYSLGVKYQYGIGVDASYFKALSWYGKAADPKGDYKGHRNAQFNLAQMYEKGLGLEKDHQQAMLHYVRAGFQGHAQAQYRVAMKYAEGEGVDRDYIKAYAWLLLAMDTVPNFNIHEKRLTDHMTVEEEAGAHALYVNLREKLAKNLQAQ